MSRPPRGSRCRPARVESVIEMITQTKKMELAAYHPRFIVDQVLATCRFMKQPPHFEPRFIAYAVDNLRVRRPEGEAAKTAATKPYTAAVAR